MTGLVEYASSPNVEAEGGSRVFCGPYVADDDSDSDSDNEEYDGGIKAEPVIPKNISDISSNSIAAKIGREFKTKNHKHSKGIYVDTEVASPTIQPVTVMCSEFPTAANSVVGVGVACGAMNPFSKDVPYNSAGLALASPTMSMASPTKSMASPMSLEMNPLGFRSEHSRRRRRPFITSSILHPSLSPNHKPNSTQRRLKTSNVNMPRSHGRRSTRSSSRGVERFSYAKALLRSDHELEKLARKIRLEINESELFELAEAAEKAAEQGEDNFSGRPSTFDGKPNNHQQNDPKFEKATSHSIPVSEETNRINISSRPKYFQVRDGGRFVVDQKAGGSRSTRISEQTLLEHARAAAAAVVVHAPSVKIQNSAQKLDQKEPSRRSMRIDSLRNVNEVIPQWNELHGHMRTHFYRENVAAHSLFFCEIGFKLNDQTTSISKVETKYKDDTNHYPEKSFFGNIAYKFLPEFRSRNVSPEETRYGKNSCDHGGAEKSGASGSKEAEMSRKTTDLPILSSDVPSTENSENTRTPIHLVPLASVSDNCKSPAPHILPIEKDGNSERTLLTPRLRNRPEQFDVPVLHIAGKSPQRSEFENQIFSISDGYGGDSIVKNVGKTTFDSFNESPQRLTREMLDVSSPERTHAYTCPASPPTELVSSQFQSRFTGSNSPKTPMTPTSSIIPRRKESGFNTPAHLRMIKRLHHGIPDERRPKSPGNITHSKSEDFQRLRLQDEIIIATPAIVSYSQFEPNSIVADNSFQRPSLEDEETRHLSIPSIQISKSENDLHSTSRKLVRRTFRTQWQHGSTSPIDSPITPTDSRQKIVIPTSKENADFICETPSSTVESLSESSSNQTEDEPYGSNASNEETKSTGSSSRMKFIIPPHQKESLHQPLHKGEEPSGEVDNMRKNSIGRYMYTGKIEEKKECDSATSSFDQTLQNDTSETILRNPESLSFSLNLFPIPDEGIGEVDSSAKIANEDDASHFHSSARDRIIDMTSSSQSGANKNESTAIANNAVKEQPMVEETTVVTTGPNCTTHCDDTNNVNNVSVCHSLPSTDVNFKTAVETVQGVFSTLSLGSSRGRLLLKDWKPETDNKEFLRNYFYCAKAEELKRLHRASASEDTGEGQNTSHNFGERLACVEPCNGRDTPCYMFGIDTMCGGLMDLLPDDINIRSMPENRGGRTSDGVFSYANNRDRTSSISNGQDISSSKDFDYHEKEGNWLNIIQKVASERLSIRLQTEEHELERSRHPFTPPCLKRKVTSQNQTL